MQYLILFALLPACVLADISPVFYSYSEAVGSGSGTSYYLKGEGRITAVRVWEANNAYINGFQFRYGYVWSAVVGFSKGFSQEIELDKGEYILQISGKYGHYVQSVVFTTNRGRTLIAGQPSGKSFNMYSPNRKAELRYISGRFHGAITSIGAHWAVVYQPYNTTALHSVKAFYH